jgi:replicative DNA helicase
MSDEAEFTPLEERNIISIALEEPDFFGHMMDKLQQDHFETDECKLLFSIIELYYRRKGNLPTRELTKDIALKHLDADDPLLPDIIDILNNEINPRDYGYIKDNIKNWARQQIVGELYSDDGIEAFKTGNFEKLQEVLDKAYTVQDISKDLMWFFEESDKLFDEHAEVKYTTGFPTLDKYINDGGPTKSDVLLWMAPTGTGKSILICNNAAACLKRGLNVLHVTCELSTYKTALRYCGIFSHVNIDNRMDHEKYIRDTLSKVMKTANAQLLIAEYPPDDISIDTIIALVEHLKKSKQWVPDVIAIDYLELLLSRNAHYNKDEYLRQKKISTEVRQLAKKTGTFVISATQTNRGDSKGGKGDDVIDLNRVSESFGKTMPVDYVISINQNRSEYNDGQGKEEEEEKKRPKMAGLRFYIAKNRNGPKFKTVYAKVNFNTMVTIEEDEHE